MEAHFHLAKLLIANRKLTCSAADASLHVEDKAVAKAERDLNVNNISPSSPSVSPYSPQMQLKWLFDNENHHVIQ